MTQEPESKLPGIELYLSAVQELGDRVIHSQRSILDQAVQAIAGTVANGGRIFVFGTGHSHLMVEEAFYRAGGLLAVVPILHPALMLHDNVALSSRLERTAGLAEILLEKYRPRAGEVILIYSNSGVNMLPVEMALLCKARGLTVIGICSTAYAAAAPLSPLGVRLPEACDISIDNMGQPGDGLVDIPGLDYKVGPSSTVIGALIWNCLLTETVYRLQASGIEAPVLISLNMPGAAEHNQTLLDRWRDINPHL